MAVTYSFKSHSENSSYGEPMMFASKEEFLKSFPGEVPHPVNYDMPVQYPVLCFEMGISQSMSGRDYQHFFFLYEFDVMIDKSAF